MDILFTRRIFASLLYSGRLNLSLFEQTKQSQIEANFVRAPNEEHHCQIGKGDEEDRFGEVAVVQKGTNSTDPSINGAQRQPTHVLEVTLFPLLAIS